MMDWSSLVLSPAMLVFGQPITLAPVASQPGKPAYAAQGVYASKAVQIPLEDGGYHSTVQPTLGIRLADYAVAPMQGDTIAIPALGAFEVVDIIPDGQGGADVVLRALAAPAATNLQDGA